MKITLLSVGKTKTDFIRSGEQEYLPRIKKWLPLEIRELGLESTTSSSDTQKVKEAEAVQDILKPGDILIALDERGKKYTSPEFSTFFTHHMNEGSKHLVFVIGGAFGWPEGFLKKAHSTLSLSPMTFTYQMTRLLLIEQIYRALTLIKGVPYHK